MKTRTIVVVLLALVCGASAAVGVSQLSHQGIEAATVETVPIVVATSDMPRGGVLSPAVVKLQSWPKTLLPPGALSKVEDVNERSVLVPLVHGEPVLEAKLASRDAGRGLAAMVPRGMRAFTIRTPHVEAGVGGFILPGNRIDVLLTTTGSGSHDSSGGGATTTLLQNVQVLAVAQRLDAPDTNKVDPNEMKSVTLLVTPDQAAKLDLGMNKGILHLSLRNPEDNQEALTRPATMAELRFHQEKPLLAEFPAGRLMEIIAGMTGGGESHRQAPQPSRRRLAQIDTLRGAQRGSIRVETLP